MKPSDYKKTRFLDMQQHPENYSDEQLEALMAELDQPVDAEAAWEEFSKKSIAANTPAETPTKSPKYSILRWWWAVAAVIAIVFGVWAFMSSPGKEADKHLAEHIGEEVKTVTGEEVVDNNPPSATEFAENAKQNDIVAKEKLLAQNTERSKDKPVPKPADDGAGYDAEDKSTKELTDEASVEEVITLTDPPIHIITGGQGNMVAGGLSGTGAAYNGFGSSSSATLNYGEDHIYTGPEQMPSFPGGDEALYQWIYDHMKYPEECREQGIQGRVMVQMVIGKDGSIESAQATRSPHEALSKEAIRLVKSMPKWEPGRHNGKIVRSYLYLPITFRI